VGLSQLWHGFVRLWVPSSAVARFCVRYCEVQKLARAALMDIVAKTRSSWILAHKAQVRRGGACSSRISLSCSLTATRAVPHLHLAGGVHSEPDHVQPGRGGRVP
jgi:hypothetical protein